MRQLDHLLSFSNKSRTAKKYSNITSDVLYNSVILQVEG